MATFDPAIFYAQSSPSASSSDNIGSSIVSFLSSTIFGSSAGGSMASISPAAMNSVLSMERRSAGSLSLSRAALGWTTTVAISLMLVQWIGNKDKKKTTPLDWMTRMLSTLWSDHRAIEPSSTSTKSGAPDKADDTLHVLLSRGSCHCGAITFKLTPAREVRAVQSPLSGKLQYPTARVPSDQLHLLTGKQFWNTYHVKSETGETWAYSFCKLCAIHLLHATDADQSSLFVNLQCFNIVDLEKPRTSLEGSFVPQELVTTTHHHTDADSVVTKTSVISTVTAATQKSFLTTVTSLPDYANPRTFGQLHAQSSSGGEDSADADSASAPQRSLSRKRTSRLPPIAPSTTESRGWKEDKNSMSLPHGMVAYSASGRTQVPLTPSSSASPSFERPTVPVAGWSVQDETEELGLEKEDDDDDDKDSISSHSGDMDYFSTEGNTAASTTATSSSSSMDFNITANRERMLLNMRKHLKSAKPSRSTAYTTQSVD